MGVRAYGRETLASLPIDVDKNWNGRSISNVNSLQANEHITITARGANRKLYPALNRYDSETDGWHISKDNNDIERKFWKDDFSVDSSDQYTGDVDAFTWDTTNKKLVCTNSGATIKSIETTPVNIYGIYEFPLKWHTNTAGTARDCRINVGYVDASNYYSIYLYIAADYSSINPKIIRVDTDIASGGAIPYVEGAILKIVVTSTGINVYYNGSLVRTYSGTIASVNGTIQFRAGVGHTTECYGITYAPSISYADNFTTDTVTGANGRYRTTDGFGVDRTAQVTYDTDHMKISANTGTGASSYLVSLASYQFLDGEKYFEVTLPAVATSGDRVGLMINGSAIASGDVGGVVELYNDAGTWKARYVDRLTSWALAATVESEVTGISDGTLTKFRIQLDVIHGVGYAYIWQGATEPVTPSLKFYFVQRTSSNPFRVMFKTASASETVWELNNISIRAESIVGRTNVEVTEPFWFRDEFDVNDSGRWKDTSAFTWDTSNSCLKNTTNNKSTWFMGSKFILSEMVVTVKFPNGGMNGGIKVHGDPNAIHCASWTGNNQKGYLFYWNSSGWLTLARYNNLSEGKYTILKEFGQFDTSVDITATYQFKLTRDVNGTFAASVSKNGGSFTGFDSITDTTWISGNIAVASESITQYEIHDLQITGTRVYNKPIHRGAMLETYFDGTEEVVGTTFVDDCQWDRLAEYTTTGSPVWDVTNGRISIPRGSSIRTKVSTGEGLYKYTYNSAAASPHMVGLLTNTTTFSRSAGTQHVIFRDSGYLKISDVVGGTESNVTVGSTALNYGTTYNLLVNVTSTTIYVYLNGVLELTHTRNASIVSGNLGFGIIGGTTVYYSNIQFIATSPDSTNGIAACIPPIGGGARYGEVEEVYHEYTNEVRKGKYLVSTCVKTTNADAEAIEMYLENTTDSTAITEDASKTVAIALADTNYMDVEKEIKLGYADRRDTLKVAVRKTSAATEVSPACYVTDLMILPKVEG